MVTQAPVNGRETEPSATEGVSRNLGDFVDDVASLGEMQIQLFSLDVKEGVSKATMPAIAVLAVVLVALGSIPVLLMAIAWCLILRAGLPQDLAYFATFEITAIVCGGVGWFSWKNLKTALPIMFRSMDELRQNLRWIRHALKKRRKPVEN